MSCRLTVDPTVERLSFRIYTDEEIAALSVVEITNSQTFDDHFHLPCDGGVYDSRLGALPIPGGKQVSCQTCKKDVKGCMGHCGHIELVKGFPIFNPVMERAVQEMLAALCVICGNYQMRDYTHLLYRYQFRLLNMGLVKEALDLKDEMNALLRSIAFFEEEVESGKNGKKKVKWAKVKQEFNNVSDQLITFLDKKMKDAEEAHHGQPICRTSVLRTARQFVSKNFQKDIVRSGKNCSYCHAPLPKYKWQESRPIVSNGNKFLESRTPTLKQMARGELRQKLYDNAILSGKKVQLDPWDVYEILCNGWDVNKELLCEVYPMLRDTKQECPIDAFFMRRILVSPSKYRPYTSIGDIRTDPDVNKFMEIIVANLFSVRTMCERVNGEHVSDDDNLPLTMLLKLYKGQKDEEIISNLMHIVQGNVNAMFDARMATYLEDKMNKQKVKQALRGIRQKIEAKPGLLRNNLMGKRVNFSGRSVAAPDALISIDEVGVPKEFALKLTYPVWVNDFTRERLQQMVRNGPHVHPGANAIETEFGDYIDLETLDETQRHAWAEKLNYSLSEDKTRKRRHFSKLVHRHMHNGDLVIMNRQPTLHRPSMQAHKVRVMSNDRVLRLPYTSCKAYNADFDGDELNLHFPQGELARSELLHIMSTSHNFLSPKDGAPLSGLIQDCVVSAVKLTIRGRFFDRQQYWELVFIALHRTKGPIVTLPPAIVKPRQLWSGKQLISTIVHNIVGRGVAKPSIRTETNVKVELWQTLKPSPTWKSDTQKEPTEAELKLEKQKMSCMTEAEKKIYTLQKEQQQKEREECILSMTESELIMRDGELLCGILDKNAIGSASHSFIHVFYELYGGESMSALLTALNCLFIHYLHWTGHTIGVREFIAPEPVNRKRQEMLDAIVMGTPGKVYETFGKTEEEFAEYYCQSHLTRSVGDLALIDRAYSSALRPTALVTKENEAKLLRRGLDNNMRMMVDTGAKGTRANMNQLASVFGSAEMDGKRMPLSRTGKSLPSFRPFETDPRACGYIPSRFMTGMTPQANYFLAIVGRDSLQHTAVKTADSGYTQRCLMKHLEGIRVMYDQTVRNSDGLILQFDYGEDGMDVTRMPFLHDANKLDMVVESLFQLQNKKDLKAIREEAKDYAEMVYNWRQSRSLKGTRKRTSPFLEFCRKNYSKVEEVSVKLSKVTGLSRRDDQLLELWKELAQKKKERFVKSVAAGRHPLPVTAVYSSTSPCVMPEALEDLVDKYVKLKEHKRKNPGAKILSHHKVLQTVRAKMMRSRIAAGEAVGALCAQSLGEPLTQMTLNTFHFAGKNELNITLGIPRMTEILRSGTSSMKTPIMEIPFLKGVSKEEAEHLQRVLTPVTLSNVLRSINVKTEMKSDKNGNIKQLFVIRVRFLPHSKYRQVFCVQPSDVLTYVEKHYLKRVLMGAILKTFDHSERSIIDKFEDKLKLSKKKKDDEEESEEEELEARVTAIGDNSEDEEEEPNVDVDGLAGLKKRSIDVEDVEEDWLETTSENEQDDEYQEVQEEQLEDEVQEEQLMQQEEDGQTYQDESSGTGHVSDIEKRCQAVLLNTKLYRKYRYDTEKQLWFELTLEVPSKVTRLDIAQVIKQTSEKAMVRSVPGIKKVLLEKAEGNYILKTEGVNVAKVVEYEGLLDVNQLKTNDIHYVANTYGIEAAQRTIISEILSVLNVYGVKVDYRHLTLLGDYFTCEGVYKACSRAALESCTSPVQQMCFETSTRFLKMAILDDQPDEVTSPSTNVCLGQTLRIGTNMVDIFMQLNVE